MSFDPVEKIYIYGLIEQVDPYILLALPARVAALLFYMHVRYVGKTSDIKKRYREHLKCGKKCPHCANWIKSSQRMGKKIHMFVLETCAETEWQERERCWIAWYRKYFPGQLTNLSDGGDGGNGRDKGFHHSDKTRKKLSIAANGRKHTKETRLLLSRLNMGRRPSDETRRKLSEARKGKRSGMLGKRHSEETKRKIRNYRHTEDAKIRMVENRKGYRPSEETKRKTAAM